MQALVKHLVSKILKSWDCENTVEIRNDEVQIEVVAAEIPTSPFKVQTTAVPPVTIISAISFTTKMDIIKQFTLNSQQKYAFTIVTSHLDGENQIHAGSTDNQLLMCVPGCGGTDESRKSSKEKQTRTFRPGDTKLENEWRHVKYLIIDEMSMVGLSLLARLNRIVKIAKHINSKIPFGGAPILVFRNTLRTQINNRAVLNKSMEMGL
ncbi:unnamed protein product, partial [Rotaria socialis]